MEDEKSRDLFLHNYFVWNLGYDLFERQQCFAINFGFEASFQIPQIILNEKYKEIDIKYHTNCFMVMIAGKYVKKMELVWDILDNLTGIIGNEPKTIFVISKYEGDIMPIDKNRIPTKNIVRDAFQKKKLLRRRHWSIREGGG